MPNIPNARNIQDALLEATVNLPAAAATAYTPALDIEQDGAPVLGNVEVEAFVPALPALVGGSVTVKLQHSQDGATFADIDALAPFTITGAAGGTTEEKTFRWRFPQATLRHIRASVAVATDGGNNTAAVAGIRLLV